MWVLADLAGHQCRWMGEVERFCGPEVNKMLIDKINSHTHEEEFISIHEKIYIVEHQHDEELVGIKQYEDKIRNLEWQLSTMEDRIVEIQRKLSP